MSSTTPNLGLVYNWSPDDEVLRAEWSGNFSKIDTFAGNVGKLEYLDTWGLSTDPSADNTELLNQRIAALPSNRVTQLVIGETYHVTGPILIDGKPVVISGPGGLKSKGSNTLLKVNDSPNFRMYGITLDGSQSAIWGLDIQDSPGFLIQGVTVKDVGNTSTDNVRGIFVSTGCDNSEIRDCTFLNIVASAVSTGVNIDFNRDTTKPSKNILIENCLFQDIKPAQDGDGIAILQNGADTHITIRNNRFIRCAKRAIKAQTRYVTSEHNYIEDSGDYAPIDFQNGQGQSLYDTIICNQMQPDNLIAACGDNVSIIGTYMYVANYRVRTDCDGLYLNNVIGHANINNFVMRDCVISGTRYPIILAPNVHLTNADISHNKFERFDGSFLIAGSTVDIQFRFFKFRHNWLGPQFELWGLASSILYEDFYIEDNHVEGGNGELCTAEMFGQTRPRGVVQGNGPVQSYEYRGGVRYHKEIAAPASLGTTPGAKYYYSRPGDRVENTAPVLEGTVGARTFVDHWVCYQAGDPATQTRGLFAEVRVTTTL